MTAIVVVAIVIIFIFGMIAGIVILVSLASHREDKRMRLSREAPDRTTLAGRYLTSLYVRRPETTLLHRRCRTTGEPRPSSGRTAASRPGTLRPRHAGHL